MKKYIIPLFAVISLYSCSSSMEIFTDHDKTVSLTGYSTYSWDNLQEIEGKGNNPLYYNELNDKRIKEAVNEQLQAKRYTVNTGNSSLKLHYHILVEDKTGTSIEPANSTYRPTMNLTRVNTYQYRQGTLIIDIMDTRTNALVWRGWATDLITNTTRKDPEAAIKKAVEKILKSFPAHNNS